MILTSLRRSKTLKRELQTLQTKYDLLSRATNDAIWDWDIVNDQITFSDGFRTIFGFEHQSDCSYNWWHEHIHPDDRELLTTELKNTFDNCETSLKSLLRFRCINGSYKHIFSRVHISYHDSKPVRLIGAMQDINEHIIALQEVEKLSLVASKTDNLVIITDPNESIEWVNEGFEKRTGYSFSEVVGKTPRILQGPETDRKTLDRIRTAINTGQSVTEEVLNYTKDGRKFWLKLNINPVFDDTHRLIRLLAVETDITELTEYRNQLARMVKERTEKLELALEKERHLVESRNQFVAIASHEFRTPLATISFATNFLNDHLEKLEPAVIRGKLEKIEKQVLHMTSLLDDVIMAGRSDPHKIPVSKTKINLPATLQKIVEDVMQSTKNSHRINFKFTSTIVEFDTDEKLIRNILINLLTNAIKFSPGKDVVDFSVCDLDNSIQFKISDKGIGIPPEDQEKLFTAFYRASNSKSISGTGLGLTIVKKAVEVLNGEFSLESKIDEGTCACVVLPVKE